jgi:hypothetical protein
MIGLVSAKIAREIAYFWSVRKLWLLRQTIYFFGNCDSLWLIFGRTDFGRWRGRAAAGRRRFSPVS